MYMLLEEEKMKNQFSKLTNRWNSGSLKWEIKENELPMWVADMDFETRNNRGSKTKS